MLWATTPADGRGGIFSGYDPDLDDLMREALPGPAQTFAKLIQNPASCGASELAQACREVSEWARDEGFPLVEQEFAEAVHYLAPDDPDSALFAGRAARHAGVFERAEQWYKRAVGLARRHGDKHARVLALIRSGTLAEQRGDTERAKGLHVGAWKAAKRHKLRKLGAYARHELLVLAIYTEPFRVAQDHASVALRLYGRFDERFPQLAHDTAFLWAHHGHFSAALPVYVSVLPYITRASERIQVLANIGRAAAATGDSDTFYQAWDEVSASARHAAEYHATALLNLAFGAQTLRRRDLASELAADALRLAEMRGEKVVAGLAKTTLRSIQSGEPGDSDKPPSEEMREMRDRLIGRLRNNPPQQ